MARVAAALGGILMLAVAPPGHARTPADRDHPRILGIKTLAPAVAGVPVRVEIRVRDPLAAVNGVQVDFGDGTAFKESACRPAGRAGGRVAAAFRPGRTAVFAFSHTYLRAGVYDLDVTTTSGDCVTGPLAGRRRLRVRVRRSVPGRDRLPRAVIAQARAGCPGAADVPTAATLSRARRATLCLVNALRAERGRRPLRHHKRLQRVARRHARDMVEGDYFAHESPAGGDLLARLRAARYPFTRAGENIAAGTDLLGTPLGVVIAWGESAPHRANMLTRRFREAGVGLAEGFPGGGGGATYTMVFGRRRTG